MRRARRRATHAERIPAHVEPLLRVVDWLAPLYRLRGVDFPAFRHLLRAKLVLDGRRLGRDQAQAGMTKNVGFLGLLALYCVFSFGIGLIGAFGGDQPFEYATIEMSFVIYMVALPLMMDFSAVLLDTSDVKVLAPLPVDGATVLAARTTHIALYLALIAASLSPGLLLFGMFSYPPLPHLFAMGLCIVLATMFTFSSVILMFVVALRRLDLTRFKNAMVWVQVAGMASLYLLSQVLPRLAMKADDEGWLERFPWLPALYPPAWFGGLYRTIVAGPTAVDAYLAPLALVGTLLLGVAVAAAARGGFLARLVALSEAGGASHEAAHTRGLSGRIGRRWARPGLERAGYRFFLDACAHERQFKLRVAPMLIVLVFPVLIPLLSSGADGLEQLRSMVPYLCFLPLLLVPVVFEAARFSEHFEARWCFESLDDSELRDVIRGSMKAVAARFLFLPLALLGTLALAIGGFGALGTTLLAAGLTLLLVRWKLPRAGAILPFTEKHSLNSAQSGTGLMMGMMLVAGLVVGATLLLDGLPFVHLFGGLVALPLGVRAWSGVSRMRFRFAQDHVNLR